MIPQLLTRNPDALVTIIIPIAHSIPSQRELGRYGLERDERIKIIHYGDEDEVQKEFAVTGMEELGKFMTMLQDGVVELYPKILKMLGENQDYIELPGYPPFCESILDTRDVDQVWISSSLSQSHKVGYEFIQIRNGPNIGKVTARTPNTVVEGTNEAIEKEFMDVFGNLNNDFGDEIRRNVERVGDEVDDDEIAREGWKEIMGL
ncbi:hypothetical protein I302_106038 [Kwoniella bestiolae CBS 10118]|uniref:Uncharacterized protein n=1 Tax=Kwoniella bestiolae CBS 10118 TaxID=1296100 RepID=A0AAJ8KAZ3_9TREE